MKSIFDAQSSGFEVKVANINSARLDPPFRDKSGLPLNVVWHRGRCCNSHLPSFHGYLEIQYIKRGNGWYFIDGQAHRFCDHTLILIKPGATHHLVIGKTTLLHKCNLVLDPKFFQHAVGGFARMVKDSVSTRLPPDQSAEINWMLQKLQKHFCAAEFDRVEMLQALLRVFFLLARRCFCDDVVSLSPPVGPPQMLKRLMEYLEANFMRDVGGVELEKRFGYTPDALSRILRGHTGYGFKRYIHERRLAEARYLLQTQPAVKIAAVAQASGFESVVFFGRVFKRAMGMTPAAYRNRHIRADRRPE